MSQPDQSTGEKKLRELIDVEQTLARIPHRPGCYLMKDRKGKIVYVGKATDLKNRVRNYFQKSSDTRAFVEKLPRLLSDIEVIITANEKEAMILENTLLKLHKPRFNVHFKDDKNFLSLRIDTEKKWPRVEVTRKIRRDKAKYFGPYHSARSLRQTLGILNRWFQLRTCPDHVLENRSRPCLQYQIKRCPAPCVFDIDKDAYQTSVEEALLFLGGRTDELHESLVAKMEAASEAMEFEQAAHFRDQIRSIEKVLQTQQAVSTDAVDRDVFGFHREGEILTIELLIVRGGKLEGARSFSFRHREVPDEEILSSFLNQYYHTHFVPDEILLPFALPAGEQDVFEELLREQKGKKVSLMRPARGARKALLETANANARQAFERDHDQDDATRDLLEKLQARLKLKRLPSRIECFDVSNLQGRQIVGSMVVFVDGQPDTSEYRRYRMRQVHGQDDFGSMREMLQRRFEKLDSEGDETPDLVVVDGGKGQLNQVLAVLNDLGVHDLDVVGLAKSRVDKTGFDDPEITRSQERVFLPGRKNPVVLRSHTAERYLMERVRDEAHRFAITFHKELRRKETLRSSLEDIPGVGPSTRKALLQYFGSLKKIRSATRDELAGVSGVGPVLATTIFAWIHGTEADPPP